MSILAINWNVDPELFRIGSFAVRWYGLLFVSGFVLGYWMFTKFFERENVDKRILDPLLYTLLLGTLVGARLGHCIFYQPDYYFGSWDGFLEIFQVWKGGLASHGGTIVLFFCMMWFARIYGDVTSLPWGFVFERRGEVEPKHPTQLYEALSYFLLGIFLLWLYVKKLDKVYRGTFIGIFFIVCFGMRFIIEFIKEPQVEFEETMLLDMGQILSIPFIILGIGFLVYAWKKKQPARAVRQVSQPPKPKMTHYAKSLND